ncbi:MAG: hypothetical protein QOD32_3051 [Pyrinomonadaceae bacterium]|jgi:hypothetical protein|nr:hypothetical protein [Pyrinomonadaceae bacterium]
MRKLISLLLLCVLCLVANAAAGEVLPPQQTPRATTQTPPPPLPASTCAAPDFRAFDFWLGTWVVKDQKGNDLGKSEITKVSGGCAIRENWSGGVGQNTGTSLNYFDRSDGKWHQLWVGSGGGVLHLSGSFEKQKMTLSGERDSSKGRIRDRIEWTALPDGRVQQEWHMSTDDGQTWTTAFLGFYSRR